MDRIGEQLQAALGDTYRIERELGGGGMARVFVAEDLTLGRRVAVKVLPPETADLVDVDRFRREMQLAARLQQPFIVPVLSAGTSGGLLYYTMPLVDGESLHARLARLKQLPVGDVVRILRDVLAALSYAHKQGIVHRDIKPANVLLSDERAMVTDFGIAKALGAATAGGSLTASGLALGTPAYMAPEQAAGDTTVDHRADLYAVGAMAYEMLAGVSPFPGASAALVMARQIREPAEPLTNHCPHVPPELAELVHRLLQKIPADRPQSADEVLGALDEVAVNRSDATPKRIPSTVGTSHAISTLRRPWFAVMVLVVSVLAVALATYKARRSALTRNARAPAGATAASDSVPSLAVLPFVNESPDTTLAYFADGMTDELITALSGLSGLTVKSRSSVFALRGKGLDPARIGDTLNVTYLLEASVRRAGDNVRITATLFRARDGTTRWSGSFRGDLRDVFAVQESIARAVVDSLRVRIGAEGTQRVVARSTTSPEAYDLYLRALELFNARAELPRSAQLVQLALGHDSLYAAAHALLASDYAVMASGGRSDLWRFARKEAGRAVQLDSSSAEAQTILAFMLILVDHDWPGAEQHFQRAIALSPSYVQARDWHALLLAYRGQQQEAVLENTRARALDPLSQVVVVHGGWIRMYGRELDSAATLARSAIGMGVGSDDEIAIGNLAMVYTLQGRFADAIAQNRRALALKGSDTLDRTELALSLSRAGQVAEARRIAAEMRTHAEIGQISMKGLAELELALGDTVAARRIAAEMRTYAADDQRSLRELAVLELALGDTSAALRWLSRAASTPGIEMLDIGVSWEYDGLRALPAFKEILRTLRLSP